MKEKIFDKKFLKKLSIIAVPIVIQNFIASSLNMVDTLLVGKLGEKQIAAVGIANQYFFLFNLLTFGICCGAGVYISQFWGKKNVKNIKKVLGIELIICIAIAILFMAVALIKSEAIIRIFNNGDLKVINLGSDYLKIVAISYIFTAVTFSYATASRCIENTALPMCISAIAFFINVILDYVLIFGYFGFEAKGVEGAAIATLIARGIEMIMLVSYIYLTKGVLRAKLGEMFDLSREFVIRVLNTIITVVLNEMCWGLGMTIYAIIYGRIGTKAIATIQICTSVQNIFMIITFGLSNASMVMIGNVIGAGKKETGKLYAKRFLILGVMVGAILGAALAISARGILSIFNISNEVYYDGVKILYIIAATLIVKVINVIIITGILRSGGDTKYALKTEAFTMWFIGVPLAFLGALVLRLPIYVVFGMVILEEITKFIVGIKRTVSNKWIKDIIVQS